MGETIGQHTSLNAVLVVALIVIIIVLLAYIVAARRSRSRSKPVGIMAPEGLKPELIPEPECSSPEPEPMVAPAVEAVVAPSAEPEPEPEREPQPAAEPEYEEESALDASALAEAVREAETSGETKRLPALYFSLAQRRLKAGEPAEAADLLRKCIRSAASAPQKAVHGKARVLLGDIAHADGDPTTACEHWQIARAIFHELNDKLHHAEAERRMLSNGCPTDWVLTDF